MSYLTNKEIHDAFNNPLFKSEEDVIKYLAALDLSREDAASERLRRSFAIDKEFESLKTERSKELRKS